MRDELSATEDSGKKDELLSYKQLCDIIDCYNNAFRGWISEANRIYKIYENDEKKDCNKFASLYANIETLQPALFSRKPKPQVLRRRNKNDPELRIVSEILESICDYFVDETDFFDSVDSAVLDRLVVGRGQVWGRYEPEFNDLNQLINEKIEYDYLHYTDFGHNVADNWSQVNQVWRITRQSKNDFIKIFPEIDPSEIDFKAYKKNDDDDKMGDEYNSACEIYEVWCKQTKAVYFLTKDLKDLTKFEKILLIKTGDTVTKHKGFFPCPMPLYGKTKNKTLIPIPDYHFYKNQAEELNKTTEKFYKMIDHIKVKGVVDGSIENLSKFMNSDDTLTAINDWKSFAEKGGLKGSIDWFDFKMAVDASIGLLNIRQNIKQDLQEITGISDIVRGASNPNETASAQNLKGRFVSVRLSRPQRQIEIFCRDLIILTVECVLKTFSTQTIANLLNLPNLSPQDETKYILKLQQEGIDFYQINVETDSTVASDTQYEQSTRMEAINGIGGFLMQSVNAPPQIMPLVGEMLKFVVHSYPSARSLEQAIDKTVNDIVQKMQNPEPPQPDPKIEAEKMKIDARLQEVQIKADTELKKPYVEEQATLQADMQRMQAMGGYSNVPIPA